MEGTKQDSDSQTLYFLLHEGPSQRDPFLE